MQHEIPDDEEMPLEDVPEVAEEDMDEGVPEDPETESVDADAIRHRNARRAIEALRESKALRDLLADDFYDFDQDESSPAHRD